MEDSAGLWTRTSCTWWEASVKAYRVHVMRVVLLDLASFAVVFWTNNLLRQVKRELQSFSCDDINAQMIICCSGCDLTALSLAGFLKISRFLRLDFTVVHSKGPRALYANRKERRIRNTLSLWAYFRTSPAPSTAEICQSTCCSGSPRTELHSGSHGRPCIRQTQHNRLSWHSPQLRIWCKLAVSVRFVPLRLHDVDELKERAERKQVRVRPTGER